MFDAIKRLWKGIRRMFGYTVIKDIVGKDVALSEKMIDAVNDWKKMLYGEADWVTGPVKSLGIESGICREFADAVLVEMESNINNEKLDKVYQKCIMNLNEELQEGLGLGSLIIRPLGENTAEYITADRFIPIRFGDDGKLLDVGFLSVKRIGQNDIYTKFERHYFTNGNLTIENKCFHSESENDIGIQCDLDNVEEWKDIAPGPVMYPGMNRMDFGYYRNPVKNRIDGSKCGVAVFESAKELICKADMQGARYDWEYESGERAIHVDSRALKHDKRKGVLGLAKLNKRLYRGLDLEDGKDRELFKDYSPEMRDEAYKRGLEEYKRQIEFNVGLAYGDLSEVQQVEKTAEEVKSSKLRKYNRVGAIQKNLKDCLEDFVAGLAFYNSMLNSGYEFSCVFNDSILTDEEKERQTDRADMAAGIMSKVEYRMKWYDETEEEAKKHVVDDAQILE